MTHPHHPEHPASPGRPGQTGPGSRHSDGEGAPRDPAYRAALASLALLLPLGALFLIFSPVLRAGATGSLLGMSRSQPNIHAHVRADLLYQAWLTARNARTLATRPSALFETEHCAPMRHSITLGVPLLGYGMLALPAERLGRHPIAAFHFAVAASLLLAYAGALLLVRELTGSWYAGIAAGVLFAFHPLRIAGIHHPAEWDLGWGAMACWLALHWLRRPSWLAAAALGASGAMLVLTSFYQTLAGLLVLLPFGVWLLGEHGARRVPWAQAALALAVPALAACLLFWPYVETRASSPELLRFHGFFFLRWADLQPGGGFFPGWTVLLLALVGLAAARGPALRAQLALLGAVLLVALLAAGPAVIHALRCLPGLDGASVPLPYVWLSQRIPGLDSIRVIPRLWSGAVLALSTVAGCGAAAVMRRWPAAAIPAILGASFAFVASGATRSGDAALAAYSAPISPAARAFYQRLGELPEPGALLEVPVSTGYATITDPDRILYSYYHGLRTSACFGSYRPAHLTELAHLAQRLPAADARERLRAMGFGTVVVHTRTPRLKAFARRLAEPRSGLPVVLEAGDRIAFRLAPGTHPGGQANAPSPDPKPTGDTGRSDAYGGDT